MWNKSFQKISVIKLSTNFAEAVKVFKEPLIEPGENELLIKNIYAGVNASDVNATAGRYFNDGKLPFDIGFEGLGIVHAIGKNVKNFKVGQPALVFEPRAFTEYIYLKPQNVIPIPELKPQYLGCLVSGLTASMALDKVGEIKPGESVLITAAAGGTGQMAVQWAKKKGCHVIGMTSSEEKAKLLKELGTDRVINYKTEDLNEVLKKEYPQGVDVVWESIGGEVFKTLSRHLKIKGRLILIGSISGYTSGQSKIDENFATISNRLILTSSSLRGFMLFHFSQYYGEYLPKLIEMVHKNEMKVQVDLGDTTAGGEFQGIESIVRAVEHLHSGKSAGKVVVKIQDP